MRRSLVIAAILCWAMPASSEVDDGARNRASFQVEAMREIANDWATARLSVVAEAKDPAVVATSVNRQMSNAMATAKRVRGVEVRSGAYVTQPIYDEGRVVRWRARQELRVESSDVDRLAELIGQLQGDAVLLSGIDFSVQRVTRTKLEDALIEEALASFRARAALIAKGMGAEGWSLISLSVGRTGGQPRRVQMRAESDMMAMSTSRPPPPVFEAGTSEIRIQVSGNVELD